MSESLIVRRGGSSGSGFKAVAFIDITYPEGSTAIATNGTDVVALNDTSGTGTIGVPSLGSWTVSCTDGVNIKSQTVELTENGQTVEIEIHYFEAYIEVTTSGTVFNTQLKFSDGNNNYYHTMADNGTYQLIIYTPGDWTIVGQRDNQTITKTINISANNSINKVNLIFRQYLFKENSGSYTSWTSGGGTYGTGWDTSRKDYLRQSIGGWQGYVTLAYLYANNAFNATNYTTLVVTGYGNCDNQTFGVSSSYGGSLAASGALTSSSSKTTYNVDITRISGNAYFVIYSKGSYTTNSSFIITDIYFK